MSTITDLPLHEVILKIMYLENTNKAKAMTTADVLWKIDNPEISERQVREVLDWLVRNKKATLYLGKYSIDRVEFLEQKENHESLLKEEEQSPSKKKPKKEKSKRTTFYVNPPKVKKPKYQIYILILGILVFGYITYTFFDLNHEYELSKTLQNTPEQITNDIPTQKKLYVSSRNEDEDENVYDKDARRAISNSFARQNTINNLTVKELNTLKFTLDSITKSHQKELLVLQNELNTSVNLSNTFIEKLIYCNFVIILLFCFFYFRKR